MKTKKAISLIVLVITIVIMLILAGAVIVTISNTNIIERAKDAKDKADLKTMQELVQTLWADAYVAGARTKVELETAVNTGLVGVDTSKYDIDVRVDGVTVTLKPAGGAGEQEPELNEDGYYYNVPYVVTNEGIEAAIVFYSDNTLLMFGNGMPIFDVLQTGNLYEYYEYNDYEVQVGGSFFGEFSPDGETFDASETLGITLVATGTEHGVYYGYNYVDADGNSVCFAENGAIRIETSAGVVYQNGAQWSVHGHLVEQANLGEANVSIDGNTLYFNEVVYERGEEIERGTAELAEGLYNTGAISAYEAFGVDVSGMLITSWEDLLEDETIHVENGVVYTNYDENSGNNTSSDILEGDLVLPTTGITSIGENAFAHCEYLTDITIPNSVTTIGESAFMSAGLQSVTIPNSVTTLGQYLFDGSSLQIIEFEDNSQLTVIPEKTFYYVPELDSVILPNSITTIATMAFWDCITIKNLTIGNNVTIIGEKVFSGLDDAQFKFGGTMNEWNAITKENNWNDNCGEITVICTDGIITVPANYARVE